MTPVPIPVRVPVTGLSVPGSRIPRHVLPCRVRRPGTRDTGRVARDPENGFGDGDAAGDGA
jgi:hypothetical protein